MVKGAANGTEKKEKEKRVPKGEEERYCKKMGPPQEAVLPSTATFADKKLFCACVILRHSRVEFGRRPPLVHCFVLGPRCLLANSELGMIAISQWTIERARPAERRESRY